MTMARRQLSEKINSLGNTEHLEIYKIIQENGVSFTENNNGIFFNLTTLSEEVLNIITNFVHYCCENKTELDAYDKKLKECKYRNNINNILKAPTYQSSINEPLDKRERWKDLIEEIDKTGAVRDFVEKINTNVEKQCAKRLGTKYAMARKKFVKKSLGDLEIKDELMEEAYLE